MAAQEGASLDLVPVLIGTFLITLGIGSLFVYERPLHAVVSAALKVSVAVTGRPRGDTVALIDRITDWMTAVRLSWTQIGRIIGWGTVNWLLDCACFAMMFLALGAPIPWKGLLLAYGAGQLAATLPITPGGLGVVEGSITLALVEFGGPEASTAYAVLLYRLISFWMILLVGWLFIGQLALQVRRGRWARQALSSEVEAGPEAYEAAAAARGRTMSGTRATARVGSLFAAVAVAALLLAVVLDRPHRLRLDRRRLLSRPADGGQRRGRARPPGRCAQVHVEPDAQCGAAPLQPPGHEPLQEAGCLHRRLHGPLHRRPGHQADRAPRRARWRWRSSRRRATSSSAR